MSQETNGSRAGKTPRTGEKPRYKDGARGNRKPSERTRSGEDRKPRGDRKFDGDDRKPRGDRKFDKDRKPREERKFDKDRKPRGDRKFDGERKLRGERAPREEREERKERTPRENRAPREERVPRENEAAPRENERPRGQNARRPRGGVDRKQKKRIGPSSSRTTAHKVLTLVSERDAFARELLSKHIDASSMSREDRAFATRLVLGVVSTRGTLDEVIDMCLQSPDDVQEDVRIALRIATYEMLFLEKDAYVAVNEGVELVRSFSPAAARLANAVLRKVSNKATSFPFGDAARETEAFARKYAFPKWMALMLLRDLGVEDAQSFMEASNEPAPLYLAINAAKAAPEDVLPQLETAKGAPEQVFIDGEATPGCYVVADARVLHDAPVRPLLEEGKILVSDAAAQTVAALLLPEEKPASFLEIGAGRGTKTVLIQSQAIMKYGSQLDGYVAVDNREFKTRILAERAELCGVNVSEALTGDALALSDTLGERTFDAVFVDAPCSGLGTLRRHPEIRWRLQEEDVSSMAEQGLNMLKQASQHVAPGGTLVYATCTVSQEENNAVVRHFLKSEEGAEFALAPLRGKGCFSTRLASGSPDAHFAVRFVRACPSADVLE